MEVVNTKSFEVIFSFVEHPYFGFLVEANAVQLLDNGNPSLTYQRIRSKNCDYFGLDEAQKRAVNLIESYEVDSIIKKFYTGNKQVRSSDFFTKHFNEDTKKRIQAYIESKLVDILVIIKDFPLYRSGNLNEPMGYKVRFSNEPASVLFHFRRNEDGMNYFVTIKHQDQKVNIYHNNCILLVGKPAWLLAGDQLLFFQDYVDGKKIKPFFEKKYIHVDPKQESIYLEKFVQPLLENHDVFAKGFDIVTEKLDAVPVLRLSKLWDNEAHAVLFFKYGGWLFPYHVDKRVNVSLTKSEETYIFHRIRRSYHFENKKIQLITDLGLQTNEGSLLSLPTKDSSYKLIEWFNEYSETLIRNGFKVEQEDSEVNYYLGEIDLKVKVSTSDDWFDVMAIVTFGTFEIPFRRLKNNILQNKREFVLPDGQVAIIPEEWFSRFSKVLNFSDFEEDTFKIKKIHVALLDELEPFLEEELPSTDWVETIENQGVPSYVLPDGFKAEMRDYQKQGYDWLRYMLENGLGALLADDMGLGKTVQTLAVIQEIVNKNKTIQLSLSEEIKKRIKDFQENKESLSEGSLIHGPCMVVCPKSLLHNWKNEAKKFTPDLKVLVYSGINRQKVLQEISDSDLVVLSYGTLRNDIEILDKFEYPCMILDESQAIKNPASLTSRSLLKVKAKKRIALTGTPIENTLLDIWSQMNFLNPGLLGSYTYFDKNFIRPIEKSPNGNDKKTNELKRFIDPFVLRRTKGQVMKELPPKFEKIHYCEMNEAQAELYERIKSQYRNEILSHVNEVGMNKSRLKIFNGLMHLRQIALNPKLKDHDYKGRSGKDDEILHMIIRAIDNGHKILLFSQFVGYLKNIGEHLKDHGLNYCYLDGSMDEDDRSKQIDRFQEDDSVRIFLLSLRAGNSGLNLTAADYVFLADPWWNPFTMKQAEDRAHRMGQEKSVFSYKFITKNTIEEKILTLQQKKTKLAESIIPDEDTLLGNIDLEELEELLN